MTDSCGSCGHDQPEDVEMRSIENISILRRENQTISIENISVWDYDTWLSGLNKNPSITLRGCWT